MDKVDSWDRDDIIKALKLNKTLAQELTLILLIARDKHLLIIDENDLAAMCSYLIDDIDKFRGYGVNKRNLNSILRQVNVYKYGLQVSENK